MPAELKNTYQDVPVLVLGASGFIGRWVARRLSELGADLHLAIRNPKGMQELMHRYAIEARVWTQNFEDPGAATRLCDELRPAIVFNLAGYGVMSDQRSEHLAESMNRSLPVELARACERINSSSWNGQGLVHAGSALEYQPSEGPIDESSPSIPTTLYGKTKLAGMQGVKEVTKSGRLRAVEGRIFTAYGPGERCPRLLPSLIELRNTKKPIELTEGLQQRDFVYVEDVAEALVRLGASTNSAFAIVNVATGRLRPVREFIDVAAETLGIDSSHLQFGALPYRPEEMWHGDVAVEALRTRIGWIPTTSIEDGIRSAVGFLAKTV